jgi:hypothetical protein
MKKLSLLLLLVFVSAMASATVYNATVYPTSVTDTTPAVGVAGDYAPGFAGGSVKANETAKTALIIDIAGTFGKAVTIGDLKSVSYYTKTTQTHTEHAGDWYLELYTVADGTDDDSWYGRRLNSEPYLTGTSAAANQWNLWSTDAGATDRMRFFDANRSGVGYGSYVDPFLSDLTSGAVDWSDYWGAATEVVDYRSEQIWFAGISTGSGWADTFDGQVDGLRIELNDGDIANFNFEPVPEPATMALLALGGLLIRRKQ